MNDEVYSTPQSNLDMEKNIDVPEDVLKKIRNAWVAGLISIVVTFVFTLISILGTDILGLDAFAFVDVFLMAIFTFGIYKKSRTCAVLMLLLFAANKVIMWFESGSVSGLPVSLIFLYFYFMGVVGTFQYHKIIKQKKV